MFQCLSAISTESQIQRGTSTNTSTGRTGACVPFYLRLCDDGTVAPKHVGVFKLIYNL